MHENLARNVKRINMNLTWWGVRINLSYSIPLYP